MKEITIIEILGSYRAELVGMGDHFRKTVAASLEEEEKRNMK